MYIFYSLASMLIPILIIGAVIYLIVRSRQGKMFTVYNALMGYFYFVIAASIFTIAIGTIYFIRVAIDEIFDKAVNTDDEIALACTLFFIGMIICIVHVYGRRRVQKSRDEEAVDTIRRVYLFFMLISCSLTGLITLPLAVYRSIHYHLQEYHFRGDGIPSTEIAMAAVFVALWGFFILKVLPEINNRKNGKQI